MQIQRTPPDPTRTADGAADVRRPPTRHWWDGSQIYGSDPALRGSAARAARTASCGSTRTACSPRDVEAGIDLTGRRRQLLARPRAAARALHARAQRDLRPAARASTRAGRTTELFDKARLINAALMAKIHTVEWTPAIIAHPTTVPGMRANWWGLAGERLAQALRPAQQRAR